MTPETIIILRVCGLGKSNNLSGFWCLIIIQICSLLLLGAVVFGGWIAAALEELTNLRQVILIGPDENAYSQVDERLRKKVVFLSRETLLTMEEEEICGFLKKVMMDSELPVYLSV